MIDFTQGNTATLELTARTGVGEFYDLTGATFTTTMVGPKGEIVTIPNAQHTANPDQINFKGKYSVALTEDNTSAVLPGTNKDIYTLIEKGSDTITFRGLGILNVNPPNPLK